MLKYHFRELNSLFTSFSVFRLFQSWRTGWLYESHINWLSVFETNTNKHFIAWMNNFLFFCIKQKSVGCWKHWKGENNCLCGGVLLLELSVCSFCHVTAWLFGVAVMVQVYYRGHLRLRPWDLRLVGLRFCLYLKCWLLIVTQDHDIFQYLWQYCSIIYHFVLLYLNLPKAVMLNWCLCLCKQKCVFFDMKTADIFMNILWVTTRGHQRATTMYTANVT